VTARPCATENCERRARDDFRWCDDCTAIVMRTGHPPVLPVKFTPAWLRHAKAKDLTDRSAA
jgi:hypothetical protein